MQARLTLLLGAIALLVSSLAGATLFWALKREVQRQELTEIAGKLELIQHLIDMQDDAPAAHHLDATLDNMRAGHGNLDIWINDAAGRPIYGQQAPRVLQTLPGQQLLLENAAGMRMRGLQVPLDTRSLPGARMIVAVSTRASSQFLYAYGSALLLICALWIGATVVLAAWAVRRTLAPAKRLSAQAARIQPDNLALRLPTTGIDRELLDFVHSFNRSLDRLQNAYQQMEGFNADVAHELRTPLATLINGAQVMLSAPRSTNELREALASNLEELEALKTLVNDMLFLARADRGEAAADLVPTWLEQEIARVANYYEAMLEEQGLQLQQSGSAQVQANPGLIRRALANLISNAIKAAPPGGLIRISCASDHRHATLHVHNPGTPIPAADLPRIFDRFFRLNQARNPRSEGHGLGLAIVRAIALMHGGQVHATSDRNGTEIGLTLPVRHGSDTTEP